MSKPLHDGQHVFKKKDPANITLDDVDFVTALRKHFKESPLCFEKMKTSDRIPLQFISAKEGQGPVGLYELVCGFCNKNMGLCKIIEVTDAKQERHTH